MVADVEGKRQAHSDVFPKRLQQVSSHEQAVAQDLSKPKFGLDVYLMDFSSMNMSLNLSSGTRGASQSPETLHETEAMGYSPDIGKQPAWTDLRLPSLHP